MFDSPRPAGRTIPNGCLRAAAARARRPRSSRCGIISTRSAPSSASRRRRIRCFFSSRAHRSSARTTPSGARRAMRARSCSRGNSASSSAAAARTFRPARRESFIFGYTCVNDVTAAEVLNENADFAQWCRSKGYDTFGCLGPVIATDLDWSAGACHHHAGWGRAPELSAVGHDHCRPQELVSRISHDMTLLPGDVIACGTSIGVGSIKDGPRSRSGSTGSVR